MPFLNENVLNKLGTDDKFQVGVSDVDQERVGAQEIGVLLPYPSDPELSWVLYECNVVCVLDSGIAVHNALPQVDNAADSLGSVDYADPNLAKVGGDQGRGVRLRSNDRYTDIQQRMGHARYWFNLRGRALRVGLQIPIPRLVTVGGVAAIPHDGGPRGEPQRAFCRIAPGGNLGGFILWHAAWSLWYTTLVPPTGNAVPAADPSALLRNDHQQPSGVQAPYDQPDDNAVKSAPRPPPEFIGTAR